MERKINIKEKELQKFVKEKTIKERISRRMYDILGKEYEDVGHGIIEYEKIRYRNGTTINSFKKIYPKR